MKAFHRTANNSEVAFDLFIYLPIYLFIIIIM